jgi:hypothetical protein
MLFFFTYLIHWVIQVLIVVLLKSMVEQIYFLHQYQWMVTVQYFVDENNRLTDLNQSFFL